MRRAGTWRRRSARRVGHWASSTQSGHAIAGQTLSSLTAASHRFFALPEDEKLKIAMSHGGRAWRGFFPVGGELTSGKPDIKEGVYFGEELAADDPRVRVGLPLHGANLFPASVPELQPAVTAFMEQAERSSHAIMEGIALSLGLDAQYFRKTYTGQPTMLFRIFHYPKSEASAGWGVGEHTDYGLLTLLAQDDKGGLQVKTPCGWIDAPPIEGALVVQYWRHARPADRRRLSLDAASRAERQRQVAAVVPVLLRSGVRRPHRSAAGPCRVCTRRQRRALGQGQRARVFGDVWRLSSRQGRQRSFPILPAA